MVRRVHLVHIQQHDVVAEDEVGEVSQAVDSGVFADIASDIRLSKIPAGASNSWYSRRTFSSPDAPAPRRFLICR